MTFTNAELAALRREAEIDEIYGDDLRRLLARLDAAESELTEQAADWYEKWYEAERRALDLEARLAEAHEALRWYLQDDLRAVEQGILESVELRPASGVLKRYHAAFEP